MPKAKTITETKVSKSFTTWKKEKTGRKSKEYIPSVKYGSERPKTLTIVCDNCGGRYNYTFNNLKSADWHKELTELVCPECGVKR